MIIKVKNFIINYKLLTKQDKILVALSGGPDSIALLSIMLSLKEKFKLDLTIAHLNHGIRGTEADRDQSFSRQVAKEYKIPFYTKKIALNNKKSSEDTLRNYRYKFLIDVAKKIGANKIALGHNADDQAETIIMRLLRGAGTKGLSGMTPIRQIEPGLCLIRPLLTSSRKEIVSFLIKKDLPFVEDLSNKDMSFLRNRIRHTLIPSLSSYNPNIKDTLIALGNRMFVIDDFLEKEAMKIFHLVKKEGQQSYVLDRITLTRMHPALATTLIRQIIKKLSPQAMLHSNEIYKILALANNANGSKRLSLTKGVSITKEYEKVVFSIAQKHSKITLNKQLSIPGKTKIPIANILITSKIVKVNSKIRIITKTPPNNLSRLYKQNNWQLKAEFDFDKITLPLVLRTRRNGDKFRPVNGYGTKKLKNIFIDSKIPKRFRDSIPIVEDKSHICWIVGHRIGDNFKIDPNTKKILQLQIAGS